MTTTVEPTLTASQVTTAIESIRKNNVQLRRLARVEPYRNAGATQSAIDHRTAEVAKQQALLIEGGYAILVGLLTEEDKLRSRLLRAKARGQERPEIKARLSSMLGYVRDLQRNLPDDSADMDDACTCGAREFSGCFCNVTLAQFLASGGERVG